MRFRSAKNFGVRAARRGGLPAVQGLEARVFLSAGTVDPSFGTAGQTTLPANTLFWAGFATTPDGKLLLSGGPADYSPDDVMHPYPPPRLARLTPDGKLDPTFGQGGIRDMPQQMGLPWFDSDLTVLPDGRAVALWSYAPNLLARFKPDGSVDPAFGDGGIVHTELSPDPSKGIFDPAAMVVQGGKYVVVGTTLDTLMIARFNADGHLDPTFGIGGKRSVTFPGGPMTPSDLLLQPDGKLVAVGSTRLVNGNATFDGIALARFTPDGALDNTFGSGGRVIAPFGSATPQGDTPTQAALQPDGKIVVAGTHSFGPAGTEPTTDMLVARFNPDGSVDPTFSRGGTDGDGRAFIDFIANRSDAANAVLLQPDGKIVLGGNTQGLVNPATWLPDVSFALVRLRPDGSVDPTFGGGSAVGAGKVVTTMTGFNSLRALALQSDGRIVAAGQTPAGYPFRGLGERVTLIRYLNDIPPVNQISASVAGGVLTISGTPGDDTIRATLAGGAVSIDGVAGAFPTSTFNRVRVIGLAGNDRVDLSALSIPASVTGDDGNDTILGSQAGDTLDGGNANDSINGGGGNDRLLGGGGADNLEGALGNDTLDGGAGPDRVSGGAGIDTADYAARTASVWLTLDNVANDGERRPGTAPLTREADNLIDNLEVLLGGSGDDILVGSARADTLFGGAGDDTLRGGAGNDHLAGGPGRDQLFGETGNDQLVAEDGVIDIVDGGAGFDRARRDPSDILRDVEGVLG